MNTSNRSGSERPSVRPDNTRFSSGPCKKHPGWSAKSYTDKHLGFSHRAPAHKARIQSAIDRSATMLGLPDGWRLGIVPASDTGAFEMAMWSLLGPRPVDALVWENFSSDWATDLGMLALPAPNVHEADYGMLPELTAIDPSHDVVFVFNGTTSGVCVPDLDWISDDREGLVLCDATSAAYAMPMDFNRLDVVTWSWQKVLGGEAAHGMLALSPRAVERLQNLPAPRALPKLFRLARQQKLIEGIFLGETINTPSMLALEDLHSALHWAHDIGGVKAQWQRTRDNMAALDEWVQSSEWVEWLAEETACRSPTSMCLKFKSPIFTSLSRDEQQRWVKTMVGWLAEESAAYDIANYRSAPPGFRIWGGATVDSSDLRALTPWLDHVFAEFKQSLQEN